MQVRKCFDLLLYLGLFACAIIFVKKSTEEFMEGNTAYSEKHEPLTMLDNPTLMFCYMYHVEMDAFKATDDIYGKHLEINANGESNGQNAGGGVKLRENSSVQFSPGIDIFLNKFWHPDHDFRDMNCYKIMTRWNGSVTDMKQLKVQYYFWFMGHVPKPFSLDAKVMFTSEENSYGVGLNRWFDGDVVPIQLKRDTFYSMKVFEVTEYHNLEPDCSQDSYFQCLAKRLLKTDLKRVTIKNSHACEFEKLCLPFSMPFVDNRTAICTKRSERQCYGQLLKEVAIAGEKHCQRSCIRKEFKVSSEVIEDGMANGISFEYSFGFPHSTPVVRSYKLFKTIKEEYLIISWMSLLGNVGGTLGMFIGFSFITTSEWAIDAGLSVWKRCKLF